MILLCIKKLVPNSWLSCPFHSKMCFLPLDRCLRPDIWLPALPLNLTYILIVPFTLSLANMPYTNLCSKYHISCPNSITSWKYRCIMPLRCMREWKYRCTMPLRCMREWKYRCIMPLRCMREWKYRCTIPLRCMREWKYRCTMPLRCVREWKYRCIMPLRCEGVKV
jgi:hypothetical protein